MRIQYCIEEGDLALIKASVADNPCLHCSNDTSFGFSSGCDDESRCRTKCEYKALWRKIKEKNLYELCLKYDEVEKKRREAEQRQAEYKFTLDQFKKQYNLPDNFV